MCNNSLIIIMLLLCCCGCGNGGGDDIIGPEPRIGFGPSDFVTGLIIGSLLASCGGCF